MITTSTTITIIRMITTIAVMTTTMAPHQNKLEGIKNNSINKMGMIKRHHAKLFSFSLGHNLISYNDGKN
jgi:hypothetical protein